jgi:hypothetical protein
MSLYPPDLVLVVRKEEERANRNDHYPIVGCIV